MLPISFFEAVIRIYVFLNFVMNIRRIGNLLHEKVINFVGFFITAGAIAGGIVIGVSNMSWIRYLAFVFALLVIIDAVRYMMRGTTEPTRVPDLKRGYNFSWGTFIYTLKFIAGVILIVMM